MLRGKPQHVQGLAVKAGKTCAERELSGPISGAQNCHPGRGPFDSSQPYLVNLMLITTDNAAFYFLQQLVHSLARFLSIFRKLVLTTVATLKHCLRARMALDPPWAQPTSGAC